MTRPKYVFFAPDKESAKNYVNKITKDYEIQTGKQLRGTLVRAKKQIKTSNWDTWEY